MPGHKLNTYFNDFILQQRSFYETVAAWAWLRNDTSKFLNLGYKGQESENVFPEDQPDTLAMNLYFKTLEGVKSTGIRRALEIGCGRGGGCYILKKYYGISQVCGMDMNRFNILNARRNTREMDIHYVHRNFLNASPGPDDQYDLLLSVDTCQTYQDLNRFLDQAMQYLLPGGILAYSDFAFETDLRYFKEIFSAHPLEIRAWEDLSENMYQSMTTGDAREKKLPIWQRLFLGKKLQRYLAWSSSEIETMLRTGELRYFRVLAGLR